MPHVTLVSDLEPDANWSAFDQLVSLAKLLSQSGHTLSLWLSPKARDKDVWPRAAEKLSPCPKWTSFEALRSLPFWMRKKTDILHFVPNMQSRNHTHAFAWLAPFLKGFQNPLIVSSFFSWPNHSPFHLRQLLHLSDLVLTPSEYLRHLISSDPHSTSSQSLSQLSLLPYSKKLDESQVPAHYLELRPFLYLPGSWEDWENPVENLAQVLEATFSFKGWIIAGNNWPKAYLHSKALQQLLKRFSERSVFFPEQMSSHRHQWLAKNAVGVWMKGLKLSSLTLSQSFEDGLNFENALLFSKLQSTLHSPHWARLYTRELEELMSDENAKSLGQWLNDPHHSLDLVQKVKALKASGLQPDPANQINRLYSSSLSNRFDE